MANEKDFDKFQAQVSKLLEVNKQLKDCSVKINELQALNEEKLHLL